MAYDQFPKNDKELKKAIKSFPVDNQVEIIQLFHHLKKNFKSIETPINIDTSKKSVVNVTRMLDGDFKLNDYLKSNMNKVRIKFGNGSSGNRGKNNRGNLFEPQFAEALMKWWAGEDVKDSKMLDAINDIDKTYQLRESKNIKVDVVGGENTKRPLVFNGSNIQLSNPKGVDFDIGKSVTDITIHTDKQKIYLSLKLGGTTTFFNVGVKKIMTRQEIEEGEIQNPKGKSLLKMFGIDNKRFCAIFNGHAVGGSEKVSVDATNLKKLLNSGIGYNYHIIHKLSGKILSKKMDKLAMNKASRVGNATVHYGGKTGKGKRIDITFQSPTYNFKINIRDTQGGDGYPTRMMCDFTYV